MRAYRNAQRRKVGNCDSLPEKGGTLGSGSNETSYIKRLEIQVILCGMSINKISTLRELPTHVDSEPGEQGTRLETPLDVDFASKDALSLASIVFGGPEYGTCGVLEKMIVCTMFRVIGSVRTCSQGTDKEKLD